MPMSDTAVARAAPRHEPRALTEFAIRNLSLIGFAQGWSLHHYRAGATSLATVAEPGFFADAADMFTVGDMVMVSGRDYGTILVVSSTRPVVTTAPLQAA